MTNIHICWNRRPPTPPTRLDLDGGYMGKIYPIGLNMTRQLYKKGALYWMLGKNTLPEHMKDYAKLWDNTTNQNFILDYSSYLNYENG